MKYSLLDIVQDVLNDMDADFVNSIDETVEGQQVAQIAKSCFNEMMSNRNWPHLKKLFQLQHSGTLQRPTHLKVPPNVKELEWLKYNKSTDGGLLYQDVKWYSPEEFLRITHGRNLDLPTTVLIQDFSGTPFVINNDQPPSFWTTFDDDWIVFDSFDNSTSSTLMASDTQAFGYVFPDWEFRNDFVPDLPEEAFAAFVEEVKSTAFLVLKQVPNQKAEQKAARQQRWLSRKAWRVEGGLKYPNYGRRGRK